MSLNETRLAAANAVRQAVHASQSYATDMLAQGMINTTERSYLSLAIADLHMAAEAVARALQAGAGEDEPPRQWSPWPPTPGPNG